MEIEIRRPDDWHLHLRDGAAMQAVLPFTAARFARAIVMPNLKPPVTTTDAATQYRARIVAALPKGARFTPLITLYLTDRTAPGEIDRAAASKPSSRSSDTGRSRLRIPVTHASHFEISFVLGTPARDS